MLSEAFPRRRNLTQDSRYSSRNGYLLDAIYLSEDSIRHDA